MARRRRSKGLRVRVLQRGDYCYEPVWVEARVREMVARMFSARMANTLSLRVEMRETRLKQRKAIGLASYAKPEDASRKDYTITLHKYLNLEQFFKTLSHELEHIRQYAQGRLKHRYRKTERTHGWLWKPEGVTTAIFFPYDGLAWKDRPWEQGAMRAEVEHGLPSYTEYKARVNAKRRAREAARKEA